MGVKLEQEDYSLDGSRFKTAKGCVRRLVVKLDQLSEFSRSSCSSLVSISWGRWRDAKTKGDEVQNGRISWIPTIKVAISCFIRSSCLLFGFHLIHLQSVIGARPWQVNCTSRFWAIPLNTRQQPVPHGIFTVASIRRGRDIYHGKSRACENFISTVSLLFSRKHVRIHENAKFSMSARQCRRNTTTAGPALF
jgi:hypothetical protein